MIDHIVVARRRAAIVPMVTLSEQPHWQSRPGYKSYRVLLGDRFLGVVEHGDKTFERRTPGKTYVNRRWTRRRWMYAEETESTILVARIYCDTRKEAVAQLVESLVRKGAIK